MIASGLRRSCIDCVSETSGTSRPLDAQEAGEDTPASRRDDSAVTASRRVAPAVAEGLRQQNSGQHAARAKENSARQSDGRRIGFVARASPPPARRCS